MSPFKKEGQTSISKSIETGLGLSEEKLKKRSPLPIQIDIIDDSLERRTFPPKQNMSLNDLLCVSAPKKKKNWKQIFSLQAESEAQACRHIDFSSSNSAKLACSSGLSSSVLGPLDDVKLGKRSHGNKDTRVTFDDLDKGVESGLINWHEVVFSKEVVQHLKGHFKSVAGNKKRPTASK